MTPIPSSPTETGVPTRFLLYASNVSMQAARHIHGTDHTWHVVGAGTEMVRPARSARFIFLQIEQTLSI
jgi:hypothetical protein